MDIFSYAKTPNEPLDRRRALLFMLGGASAVLGFGGAGWYVAQTGSVAALVGMTAVTALSLLGSFRFTRATMRLSERAATMAWDFLDDPPPELLPTQRAIFDRLISWKRDPVSEGSALAAMWGGLVLALVPLGMLALESPQGNLWGAVAALAGIFTSLLLIMTTLDHSAIRPVVGILARAQLERLTSGTAEPVPNDAPEAGRRVARPRVNQ